MLTIQVCAAWPLLALNPTVSLCAFVTGEDHDPQMCVLFCLPGVKLTLAALIEGKSINQGGHKVGLGLDLEA